MTSKDELGVVIPSFFPPLGFDESVASLASEVAIVVVVDDSAGLASHSDATNRANDREVVWMVNHANLGIAAALNVGVDRAFSSGVRWVLTLDQDSLPDHSYIEALLDALASLDWKTIAVPEKVSGHPQQSRWNVRTEALEPIQAGMTMHHRAWNRVGKFKEDLFIDAVDTDFIQRCRLRSIRPMLIQGLDLVHKLGEPEVIRFGPIAFNVNRHASWRRYYITRNRLYAFRRYGRLDLEWLLRKGFAEVKDAAMSVLASDRRSQSAAFLLGVRDFARGKYGRIDDSLVERLRGH